MIKSIDIFNRPQGQPLDFSSGIVDIGDLFRNSISAITVDNGGGVEDGDGVVDKKRKDPLVEQANRDFAEINRQRRVSLGEALDRKRTPTNSNLPDSLSPVQRQGNEIVGLPNRGEREAFGGIGDGVLPPKTGFSGSGQNEGAASNFDPASFTFDREARKDSNGRLQVFTPPSGDGGGSFEIAGITQKFQPKEASRLRRLVLEGNHEQAEKEAKDFFRKRAEPFVKHTSQKGLQLQLADSVHNRGEGGLRRILQRATGSKSKSHAELIRQLDQDPKALEKFNQARVSYELEEVDRNRPSRRKFRKGLLSRFEQAHQAALQANRS